ncbi:Eco57I restriction-modification methylase domain-containing protein [Pararcticibacter amylolyticus]|uniref:site-specific DNA-methyltransferase (adenine-specific) n=1 Tax=Pararcticibacter amylolyticus TaxID=2173175 RepID=A0A2U2PMG5_9SPHI|nr:RNA-binding domain-containing protein [Pararcticibacter amylolyticus]PWG82595.1 ATP-binding protein [Pararcticibacter amylolyticus]
MKLNIDAARNLLQAFDFKTLFREELGWNNPASKAKQPFQTKHGLFFREAIADLSGATVYEITNDEGTIPDSSIRALISAEIQKISFHHILIFVDKSRSQSFWRWLKRQDKKSLPREHTFFAGQTGDAFISKISSLMVDLSEIENDITITDAAKKIQDALDVERVTKQFFTDYQQQFIDFLPLIEGIPDENDKRWYASVILNRLMFIYFLQKKGFIDNGNLDYLYKKLLETQDKYGDDKYYDVFLKTLFFEGFAKPDAERSQFANELLGKIKYLNGGLFLKHKIEEKYPGINIPDIAFINLLKVDEPKGLFEQFSWSLDDTPGGKDDEINPDVLGYIFEKYINQKAFGAYYTRTEITEYLCEQTVYKLILDAVNGPEIDVETLKKAGLDKGEKERRFNSIEELFLGLDAKICAKLVMGENAVLPSLSLLDPACGSGAFLVAAMKTLINVYAAIIGRISFLNDRKLLDWQNTIQEDHPSINYYIKKQIITNNLYGVDIMEEATEIAKLRLFLALVSSANNVDDLEPLPNIDFNIMNGNSLIGMMRVDPDKFNTHYNNPSKAPAGKVVRKGNLFEPALIQGNMFSETYAKSYQQLINEKEAAITAYKKAQGLGYEGLQSLRNSIQESEKKAAKILNKLLVDEFQNLSIPYSECTWDAENKKEGKLKKRPIKIEDIEALEPFHWGYEFSDIFRKKDGFDAIITNPPWETFQPNSKEFLMSFSKNVSKKKMDIKDFLLELKSLMEDETVRKQWLKYQSDYNHVREYFRISPEYVNQVPIINGKRHGKDVNLYKLFVEQSFKLLKKGGYCGIVIPSGIYNDLGSKKLRELLFEKSKITGVFGFENRKEIFEGVHRMFKFVVLSFEKGGVTTEFPSAFMRHNVEDLISFPESGAINLSVDFIKRQSPDSMSIMEIKDATDFNITNKLLQFPTLSDETAFWHIILHREFNMTDDAYLFNKKQSAKSLPLYEGKMIFHYTNHLSEPRYWIDIEEGRKALLGRQDDTNQILGYEKYRLAYRSIASNTNERTLISTIIPKCFTGNSINVSENLTYPAQLICTSFLSSFVLDWFLRQQVTTNINMFYIYQLPVPRLSERDSWFRQIVDRAAKLICTTEEFAELWEEVMHTQWSTDIVATDKEERDELRAELDGIIAHIYGLTEEEFTYILSTFPIVPVAQKQAALTCYKNLAPQFAQTSEAQQRCLNLIEIGETSKVEFKSTLRVDLKTNRPEKFIEHSVLKTIAAFLNSEGGDLLIGIEDNKNILGLEPDFASFSKADKLDEFQKHFDNLIHKSLGNRFQRYLDVSFPTVDGKLVCLVHIKEKSTEPVYLTDEKGQEIFYIRRQASTIDLKPSEANKYIKDHWK